MSLPLVLRLSGWGVSLLGGGLILLSFADDEIPRARNPFFIAGMIVFVVGMILTSSSGLVAVLQQRRRISEGLQRHEASRNAPPSPPD